MKKNYITPLFIALSSIIFFPLLTTHIRVFELLFFNGIFGAIIIVILQSLLLRVFRISWSFVTSITSITFSFNIILLTLIPVTADRSISTFMLSALYNQKQLTEDELTTSLVCEYVLHQHAVAKRLNEQQIVGNIERASNNTFALSSGGNFMIQLIMSISHQFGVEPPPISTKWKLQNLDTICNRSE